MFENLKRDQKLQKDELEAHKRELSEKINTMIKEHKEKREFVETQTWDEIEAIKEKNKQELAEKIDNGMK